MSDNIRRVNLLNRILGRNRVAPSSIASFKTESSSKKLKGGVESNPFGLPSGGANIPLGVMEEPFLEFEVPLHAPRDRTSKSTSRSLRMLQGGDVLRRKRHRRDERAIREARIDHEMEAQRLRLGRTI